MSPPDPKHPTGPIAEPTSTSAIVASDRDSSSFGATPRADPAAGAPSSRSPSKPPTSGGSPPSPTPGAARGGLVPQGPDNHLHFSLSHPPGPSNVSSTTGRSSPSETSVRPAPPHHHHGTVGNGIQATQPVRYLCNATMPVHGPNSRAIAVHGHRRPRNRKRFAQVMVKRHEETRRAPCRR